MKNIIITIFFVCAPCFALDVDQKNFKVKNGKVEVHASKVVLYDNKIQKIYASFDVLDHKEDLIFNNAYVATGIEHSLSLCRLNGSRAELYFSLHKKIPTNVSKLINEGKLSNINIEFYKIYKKGGGVEIVKEKSSEKIIELLLILVEQKHQREVFLLTK